MSNGDMRIGCSAFLESVHYELGVGTGGDGAASSLGSGTLLPSLSGEVGSMLVACCLHLVLFLGVWESLRNAHEGRKKKKTLTFYITASHSGMQERRHTNLE